MSYMTTRPTFLTTKGERKLMPFNFDPLARYRTIAKGIYDWYGLPDDVPEGYIEEKLFDYGAISAKEIPGLGICIMPANPVTFTIYGQPSSWIPTGLHFNSKALDLGEQSDNPCLYFYESVMDKAEIYGQILADSLISLQQNVIALRQPIALDGNVGNTANAVVLKNELQSGQQFIPVIDATKIGVKVIDLMAHDHTQALIATANAMDNEILTILGVKNTGTEKSSGVNIEESTSLHQELSITNRVGLNLRKAWCEKINAVLGTNFEVEVSEAFLGGEAEQIEESEHDEAEPNEE